MARKKREEEQGISAGWINTFADLMNLLLCFFVLLFSMSTVDADKYEQLVTSMTESINIFKGGGKAIGEGAFVSNGTDQLVSISKYFKEYEDMGDDSQNKEGQDTKQDSGTEKADSNNNTEGNKTAEEIYEEKKAQEQRQAAEALYGEVTERAQTKDIEDDISVNIDKQNQYVQISLNGALLFETGDVEIKKSMRPLMSKVGDILRQFKTHRIKIEGHTDNVPISGKYSNNMMLSTARANTVFQYLKDKKKIPPQSMEISGYGEFAPVASNKTAKGRAQNRRVEIKIYTGK